MVAAPSGVPWRCGGDAGGDPAELGEEGMGSSASGDGALLLGSGVGLDGEAEAVIGGLGVFVTVGETSGSIWLDKRRLFLPSCSLAAIFLLSLRS